MISLNDYVSRDGLGLAELVARKEVKPQELLEAAIAGIEKINPKLNAVLQTLPDLAGAEIRGGLPAGPFAGVPFLIKELVLHAKGVRCDHGSRLAQGFVPAEDTELMARFGAQPRWPAPRRRQSWVTTRRRKQFYSVRCTIRGWRVIAPEDPAAARARQWQRE